MFEKKQIARKKAIEARQIAYDLEPNAGEALANAFTITRSPENPTIAGYMPLNSEIDPRPIMRKLQKQGAILALPRVNRQKRMLDFHLFEFGDELEFSVFGVKEPLATAPIIEPDWLLVPLLAFDKYGWRLGYGMGFYDNAISQLKAKKEIITFGLAYSAQEIESVPHQAHDQQLNWIVTKDGARLAKSSPNIIEGGEI